MTLIIYDSKGNMLMSQTGDYLKPDGELKYIEYEVPEGYIVKSVDPETNEPVLEPIPLTKEQQDIKEIKEQMNALLGIDESEESV